MQGTFLKYLIYYKAGKVIRSSILLEISGSDCSGRKSELKNTLGSHDSFSSVDHQRMKHSKPEIVGLKTVNAVE